MNKFLCFCTIIMLAGACHDEPSYEILENDSKLVSMLEDLHIADVAVNKFGLSERDSMRSLYKKQISELYGLSTDGLDSVVWILQSDAKRNSKIYAMVVDSLMKLEHRVREETHERPSTPLPKNDKPIN